MQAQTRSLFHLKHWALVEVVGTGAALQGGESHVAPCQRGDVAELVRAQGRPLVIAGLKVSLGSLLISPLTGAAVVLVWQPRPRLLAPPIDGKALGPAGMKLQPDVCYFESLTYRKKQMHVNDYKVTGSCLCGRIGRQGKGWEHGKKSYE